MAAREVHYLYKETRLNLEPSSSSSVVQIKVPSPSSLGRSSYRSNGPGSSLTEDERVYRVKNLATTASIFHRRYHSTPRSFLWRVLENDTVLSIRAADICKQQKEADHSLILNLRFPAPIRPTCVAFSDPEEHDSLIAFVIDQANNLYTVILRPEAFRKRSATENGLGDACKSYLPPAFSFKSPHRLVSVSADQLVVTLTDGGILRFDRNKSHDAGGQLWKETFYNVSGWGQGLRSLLPFQGKQTVKYEKSSLDLATATSVVTASMGFNDASFLFTVCLDHHLRVWDVRTGQILYTGDILNATRDPQDVGKWTIDPSQANLVRVVEITYGQCLLVTYSPLGAGEFKFWRVKANDQGSIHVSDLFPKDKLVPTAPSALDVWTLADFGVAQGSDGGPDLWTLWKNNITYRIQKMSVKPGGDRGPWANGWEGVFADNQIPTAQSSNPCDSTDATEKWLDLIFFPGRFTRSTLETALIMYEKGLGTSKESSLKTSKSLAEAICSVLGSTATLDRASGGAMDYEQFRATSETQWRRFYRLLIELDKARGEALSFVLDPETGLAAVVCADSIAAIRQCSKLDRVCHNLSSPDKKSEDVSALVTAGLTFLESFSDGVWQLSKAALRSELFEDSAKTDDERIQYFWDKAGFWRQVSEEDASQVVETLGQNFRIVTPRLYEDLFDLITSSDEPNSQREFKHPFTELGRKLVLRSVQETADLQWQILFSQLILLVHMEFEFDNEDEALHSRFDIGFVYRQLITALRRLEHLKWMVTTEMTIPATKSDRSSFSGTGSPTLKRSSEEPQSITVFEGILGHLLGLVDVNEQPLISGLTEVVTDVCAPDSSTELIPYLHQCWLLKQDRPDLALEFSRFCDQDPFSTYIQGRVFLALKDYDTAALHFRKAAIGLSISTKHVERHSSRLLDDTEWNLLNSGLPNYYTHIVYLFDKPRAYSYVIEFARLALQFTSSQGDEGTATKTEMLSRLFIAAAAISQFNLAHSTLLQIKDSALRKSYLKKLVEKMSESGQNTELVSLPFTGLWDQVDEILLEKCRTTRDVLHGIPYHQILYAWRISHSDYRGAATVLLDRLQRLRDAGEGDKLSGDEVMDTAVTKMYLLLINALSCIDPEEAWILEELPDAKLKNARLIEVNGNHHSEQQSKKKSPELQALEAFEEALKASEAKEGEHVGQSHEFSIRDVIEALPNEEEAPRRRLLTIGDLRKQYQDELDRIVAIQNNQFAFADEDDIMGDD